MNKEKRYTDEEWETLREDFLGWAIHATRREGQFAKDGAERQGFGHRVVDRLVDELIDTGRVHRLPKRRGFGWEGLPPDPLQANESRTPYDAEQWAEVHHLFGAWAREVTAREGKFSRKAARLESGLSEYLADRALDWAIESGRVDVLSDGGGYRWRGVDLPKSLTARRKHTRYSAEEWQLLRRQVEKWSRQRAHFSANQVVRHFVIGHGTATRLIKEFLNSGDLVSLDYQRGYAWLGAVGPRRSLRDLIDAGLARVDENYHLSGGRRPGGSVLDVTKLTKTQGENLVTLCNRITEWVSAPTPADVPLSHPVFQGDAAAGWKLTSFVREKTESLGTSHRSTLRGTVDVLWALARSTGMVELDAPDLHQQYAETHAAEWQVTIDSWLPRMIESREKVEDAFALGLRVLARFCTRRGELDPARVRWTVVTRQIDEARQKEEMTYSSWNSARRAYERARELQLIAGPQWVKRSKRIALVDTSSVTAAVESLDFSEWSDSNGEPLSTLLEGISGLRAYCVWATADAWKLKKEKLPPREYIAPTPTQARLAELNAKAGREDFRLEKRTLHSRLQRINYLLGDLEAAEVDVAQLDLPSLCDVELVEKVAERLITRRSKAGKRAPMPTMIPTLAGELAVIASPFLEAVARQEGNDQAADAAHTAGELLREYATANRRRVVKRKNIQEIAEAWRGFDGVDGWVKLLRLRELLRKEIERLGGGSVSEQCRRIREGKGQFTHSLEWAQAVRAAVLVNFARLIPVRLRALRGLQTDMWKNNAVEESQHGRSLEPWEGEIIINFGKEWMKRKQPFRPAYITKAVVGSPRHEFGAARDLLELWFMPGGAREEILRLADGRVLKSPYVFPATVRQALGGNPAALPTLESGGCLWKGDGISDMFVELIRRYARKLKVDVDRLEKYGGMRAHAVVRLLFGTYWAPRNLVEASRMLHHRNTTITEKLYCGFDVRAATREATDDEVAWARRNVAKDRESPATESRLEEAERRVADAERRAEEAEARLAEALKARRTA